ncbi:MAG TPA: outer membrane lipoprotein carrier protein LolA [Thermodesulfovibrionales bacterium]|nr:outer membrane lipoprotein carrier protein LolA [Thermodesulfovibrionales bacterium]
MMKHQNDRKCFPNLTIFVSFLIIFLSSLIGISRAVSVEDEAAGIQKAYENIKDISGTFTQQSYIKDLKRTDAFKGDLFIKKPHKMKISYKGDNPTDIYVSNKSVLIFQKKEKQAFRSPFDSGTYGQTPIVLLSGLGKLREEFTVSEKDGRLLLKPRKPMGAILSIEVETAEGAFPVKSLTIYDSASNKITITLKDVKVNVGLEDSFFVPALPKGVTVMEHNP